MTQNQNRVTKALFAAVFVSAILPFIPILHWVLLPFDYLNTHVHEAFHALAAVGSGGETLRIEVYANSEGVTFTRGGIAPLIQSAGYIGASLLGALMIASSKSVESARKWLTGLGIALAVIMVLWVRGDMVGISIGVFWTALLLIGSRKLNKDVILFAVQFLGVQQCLNSLKSLRDLVYLSASGDARTDAAALAESTHLPATFWAVLWGVIGFASMAVAVYRATSHQPPAKSLTM
ncbi:MAG TPA: M50 family metallopeptidase [Fimbriimonas sp.]|nr:M50 family metallopeptidase [Fimbriimonas sp.]